MSNLSNDLRILILNDYDLSKTTKECDSSNELFNIKQKKKTHIVKLIDNDC